MRCKKCSSLKSVFRDYEGDYFCINCGWRKISDPKGQGSDRFTEEESVAIVMKKLRRYGFINLRSILSDDRFNRLAISNYLSFLARNGFLDWDGEHAILTDSPSRELVFQIVRWMRYVDTREVSCYTGFSKTHSHRLLQELEREGRIERIPSEYGKGFLWDVKEI